MTDTPLVVGLGGTLRANSSTERALRHCLQAVEARGGHTELFCGADLDLPMYNPHDPARTDKAIGLIDGGSVAGRFIMEAISAAVQKMG